MSEDFSNTILLYFPKRVISEIDAISPLIVELKKKKASLYTIVFNPHIIDILSFSKLHKTVFYKFTKLIHVCPEKKPNKKKNILDLFSRTLIYSYKIVFFFFLVIKLRLSGKKIFSIISWAKDSKNDGLKSRLLRKVVFFILKFNKIKDYQYPPIQIPPSANLLKRNVYPYRKMISHLEKRGEKPAFIQTSHFLSFSSDHKKDLRTILKFKGSISNIGVPRLYTEWTKFIKKEAKNDYLSEAKRLKIKKPGRDIITIILTNPAFPWFNSKQDCFSLVKKCIKNIRKVYPKNTIILKAKQNCVSEFKENINLDLDSNLFFSDICLTSLASVSIFAVSIHESSGAFDFISKGKVAIDFCNYSVGWKKIFPEKNNHINIPGIYLAESDRVLVKLVKKIKNKELKLSVASVKKYFNHNTKLDVFT